MRDTPDHSSPAKPLKDRLRLPLMLLGVAVVIGGAAYLYLSGGRFEETDDAYVKAAQVAISADVGGRVTALVVHDNQHVHKGDLLFRLDDASYRIAVAEAKAELAAARLKVAMLKASYRQRRAELAAARDTLTFAKTEYARQQRLSGSGIASQAKVERAAHALDEARNRLLAAEQQASAASAALGGNPDIASDEHPDVRRAQARLARAELDLSDTVVHAPSDGVVTRVEELQVGQYVRAAKPVFALVSDHDIWVQANFKEDQLAHMRAGETATVKVDSYPGRTFQARVVSVSPGTGSQFSVLPAENATGNWVKVVQRLPVRIEFAHADPAFPLRSGLSADVTVDTGPRRHLLAAAASVSTATRQP